MNLDRLERLITKEEFARSVEIPNKKRFRKNVLRPMSNVYNKKRWHRNIPKGLKYSNAVAATVA